MRNLLVTVRPARAERNRQLTLQYIILVAESPDGREDYGIKIIEAKSGSNAVVPNLTVSASKIYSLIETLARCTVTPTGLADVLADWL